MWVVMNVIKQEYVEYSSVYTHAFPDIFSSILQKLSEFVEQQQL
jgi:HD superfamily phosphohydrolase